MCMPHCWRILLHRGDAALRLRLTEVAALITGDSAAIAEEGLRKFESLFREMSIATTLKGTAEDIAILSNSVNLQRLSNFPVNLGEREISMMYHRVVSQNQGA